MAMFFRLFFLRVCFVSYYASVGVSILHFSNFIFFVRFGLRRVTSVRASSSGWVCALNIIPAPNPCLAHSHYIFSLVRLVIYVPRRMCRLRWLQRFGGGVVRYLLSVLHGVSYLPPCLCVLVCRVI